jgi:hypothetical protein
MAHTAVAAGDHHTLVLRSDGKVLGCGDGAFDQTTAPELPPWHSYVQVEAGGDRSAAISTLTCTVVATYCTAKLNSQGCLPSIASSGTPSASNAVAFVISASNVLNQANGLLFYGLNGPAAVPFSGGTLCVAGPLLRTLVGSSGGNPDTAPDCSGTYAIDFNAFGAGLLGGSPDAALKTGGTSVHAQWWSRDPYQPEPYKTGLSDAVNFVVCP